MTATPSTAAARQRSDLVAQLFAALAREGIAVCVLRNHETLPDPGEHDIDMLLGWAQPHAAARSGALPARLRRVLEGEGFQLIQWSCRRHLIKAAIADAGCSPRSLLHLDFFLRMPGWLGFDYLSPGQILADARAHAHADALVPRPAHEACISLLFPLLNNRRVKVDYLPRVAELLRADHDAFEQVVRPAFGGALAARLIERALAQDEQALNHLRKPLRAALVRGGLRRSPVRCAMRSLGHVWDRARLHAQRQGLDIAFIGPDGVGKTTVMQGLADVLKRSFPGGLAYQHFRPHPLRPMAGKLPAGGGQALHEHTAPGALGRGVSVLRLGVSAALFTLGYWLRIAPATRRRKLVLLDRYAYGYLLWPESLRYHGPAVLARLALRVMPRPALTLLLTAPPAVIRRRKPELSEAQIEQQLARGRALAARWPDVVEIDAGGSVEQTVDRAAAAVLQHLRTNV